MAEIGLKEKDWQRLIRTIERGQCVLMLGADIASDADNANQPPLTTLFARTLAEQLNGKTNVCDPDDLPQVAQTYIANRIGDRNDLEMDAENFYEAHRQHTTRLHQCLAQLPFSYCISITPDELMRNAFKSQGKTPAEAFYHFRQTQPLTVTPSRQSPLIYQLYGSITDSRSLVLTETDLLDFLVNIIAGKPELPSELSTLLSDRNTSFLFIGFGFHRWYLRILLHVFRKQLNNPLKSIALENTHFFSDPVHEQTVLFYDHSHAIEIKHCSWNELAENLVHQYQEKVAAQPKAVEQPLPAGAPTVFLCHSSEDSEAVEQFGEKLRALGIDTWRDRDNLRGGDDWDKQIRHLIDLNKIHYFLVLQTPNMLAKTQSYFIREIKFALYRQGQQSAGYLFIIPVYFTGQGDEKLAELTHLNYLDLRNDKDLAKLRDNIAEDQQNRKTQELSHAGQ